MTSAISKGNWRGTAERCRCGFLDCGVLECGVVKRELWCSVGAVKRELWCSVGAVKKNLWCNVGVEVWYCCDEEELWLV